MTGPAAPTVPDQAPAATRRVAARAAGGLVPRWDPMRLVLGLMMILVISRIHQHFGFIGRLRPALLLAAGALAFALMNPSYLNATTVLRSKLPRIVVGLLILACLSVPFGVSIGNSGRMILFGYSKLIIIVLLTMLAIRDHKEFYALIWAYVIGVGILAFFATFVFQLSSAPQLQRLNDLYTWDANDAGAIFASGAPLALLCWRTARGWWKYLAGAIVILTLVALVRTGSRGAFIGLLAVGFGVLFFTRTVSAGSRLALIGATVLGFMVFAPADYREQMTTILSPKDDYNWTSPQARKELAKRGLGTYMFNSPFGIGIDNFGKAECSDLSWFYRARQLIGGVKCSAPHNSFVQAGAETGVLGLGLFIAMLVAGLTSSLKIGKRVPRAWARGSPEQRLLAHAPGLLATAILSYAVAASFVSHAWQEFPYLLAVFAVGLGVVWRQVAHTVPASVPRRTGDVPAVPAAAP